MAAQAAEPELRAIVLGSAAGGGFPQWNCNCRNCAGYRAGRPGLEARSQSSLAVSANGTDWALLNASPDLRQQLAATPALHPPDDAARGSPIKAVLLTNGDIDHVAGLLTLREGQPLRLLATAEIHAILAANPIFTALAPGLVLRETVKPGETVELVPGLRATLFPVPGKVPLYLEDGSVETDLIGEQTVGVEIASTKGKRLHYIPGCARMTEDLAVRLEGCGAILFDGTLWTNDEMIAEGLGQKTGRRMGHMPMSGPDGAIAALARINAGRKIFVHINNTNPVLDARGPERAEAESAGWEIGHDGMEIML
ncbi:MAG: pyrroloquinoline quinone biosynthesis protein PqqB [Paracoccaceae bacterium]|nr:pyrroloquinoline quinone biosynthesis protein PqqB [Paracoccaceae bacterium]